MILILCLHSAFSYQINVCIVWSHEVYYEKRDVLMIVHIQQG